MIISLLGLFVLTSAQEPFVKLDLRPFEKEDRNKDSILTHDQFIDGLAKAFRSAGYNIPNKIVNDFGREFLGEKESDGKVELSSVSEWIESGEIIQFYEEWKIINDEGEEHHKAKHKHHRIPHFGTKHSKVRRRDDL